MGPLNTTPGRSAAVHRILTRHDCRTMLGRMSSTIFVVVGLLLLHMAWTEWRHEQTIARLATPSPLPRVLLPPPPLPSPELARAILVSASGQQLPMPWDEEPFELERMSGPSFWEVAPTSVFRPHPPFESYGVDISVAPTIAVD